MALKDKLQKRFQGTMNRVQERVQTFEDMGGWRGAAERARVKSEHRAREVADFLHEKGVDINLGRWIPATPEQENQLHQHYRTLGVAFGADLATVKTAYRAKMREYHPDRHASDPEKEREATEIAQKLSIAYAAIEEHLKAHA